MPSTISLVDRLRADYPEVHFSLGDTYSWSPSKKTIYFKSDIDPALLIHEISHFLLGHDCTTFDIEVLKLEREAWDKASTDLAAKYDIQVSEEIIEDSLDTYRDWLHSRSKCPKCESTGVQATLDSYKCLACLASWRVNQARNCALRRYLD